MVRTQTVAAASSDVKPVAAAKDETTSVPEASTFSMSPLRTAIGAIALAVIFAAMHFMARGQDYGSSHHHHQRSSNGSGGGVDGGLHVTSPPAGGSSSSDPSGLVGWPVIPGDPVARRIAFEATTNAPFFAKPVQDVIDRQRVACNSSSAAQSKEDQLAVKAELLYPGDASSGRLLRMPHPGMIRLLFRTLLANGQPSCRGGDVLEVRMESPDAKINLDVLVDRGNGLYEAQVFMRRPGAYTVCADTVVSYPEQPVRCVRSDATLFTEQPVSRADCEPARVKEVRTAPWCNTAASWEKDARCATVTVEIPAAAADAFEQRIATQRQRDGTTCTHPDAFRSGEWRRVGGCDGSVCVGDLNVLQSEGWIWASDYCTQRIYGPTDAWARAASDAWVVAWGDSTLKQPLANMVEYGLNSTVFAVSMENLESIRSVKKRPGFFSYRQYDVTRPLPSELREAVAVTNPKARSAEAPPVFSLSYAWGGCPAVAAAPGACPAKVGTANRDTVQRFLGNSKPGGKRLPDVVVVNHQIWRPQPMFNETAFELAVRDTVVWLHATLANRVRQLLASEGGRAAVVMPALVWVSGTRRLHDEQMRATRCNTEDTVVFERRLSWRIEHTLSTEFPYTADRSAWLERPSVRILSRYELTLPFHFGNTHGHFGVHYGSTKGMCLTGISHKQGYELSRCLRKTFPDGMLIQWWFNVLESLKR